MKTGSDRTSTFSAGPYLMTCYPSFLRLNRQVDCIPNRTMNLFLCFAPKSQGYLKVKGVCVSNASEKVGERHVVCS